VVVVVVVTTTAAATNHRRRMGTDYAGGILATRPFAYQQRGMMEG
jgi:hypothetical protein